MNEEEAILDFFSRTENLSLALTVADQTDKLREQFNNRLWRELHARLDALARKNELGWHAELTEDKNAPECLVGLHFTLFADQPLYLRRMMEQQFLGGEWRIYFGLIWSAATSPAQLGLASVLDLKATLQKAGYKSNEAFLAWKWTAFHPRRKDFLLRYANHAEKLLAIARQHLQLCCSITVKRSLRQTKCSGQASLPACPPRWRSCAMNC